MTVELICVGTELLLGNIVNTNAAWLSRQFASLGLSCYYQSVVGDNRQRLLDLVRTALGRSDVVVLSGGLGPTPDDLTKETVAEAMDAPLSVDGRSLERIRGYFRARGVAMSPNNEKQALVPAGALVLDNDNGTAPGLILEKEGKCAILLPGPPNELQPLFLEKVRPWLAGRSGEVISSVTVKLCGIGESLAAARIADLLEGQTNPTIAPYAKTGEVHLRITAKAGDEETAAARIAPVVEELYRRFPKEIYATGEEATLEQAVIGLLAERNMTVVTAESCTGGMVAARLVNVPGASQAFLGGMVTYSNEEKKRLLGVDPHALQRYGAVSEQVALQMAAGARKAAGADCALSTTGVAGPEGGTADKPVGTVFIGCQVGEKTAVRKYRFPGNRAKVRESAAAAALTLLRECILGVEDGA